MKFLKNIKNNFLKLQKCLKWATGYYEYIIGIYIVRHASNRIQLILAVIRNVSLN